MHTINLSPVMKDFFLSRCRYFPKVPNNGIRRGTRWERIFGSPFDLKPKDQSNKEAGRSKEKR